MGIELDKKFEEETFKMLVFSDLFDQQYFEKCIVYLYEKNENDLLYELLFKYLEFNYGSIKIWSIFFERLKIWINNQLAKDNPDLELLDEFYHMHHIHYKKKDEENGSIKIKKENVLNLFIEHNFIKQKCIY